MEIIPFDGQNWEQQYIDRLSLADHLDLLYLSIGEGLIEVLIEGHGVDLLVKANKTGLGATPRI